MTESRQPSDAADSTDGMSTDRIERLAQQLRSHWQAGSRPGIDEIDGADEILAQSGDDVLDLLYHEVLIREEFGEHPTLDEFARRFPHLQGPLERLFAVHQAIDDDNWEDDLALRPFEFQRAAPTPVVSDPAFQITAHAQRGSDTRQVEPPPGYELLEELGRGGIAVVYRARQISLNRIVAMKMLLGGSVASAETLARLKQEARAVAQLQHPGIVQIHEVGSHQGLPYLALEFVPGGTLHSWLKGRPLPAVEAAEIVEQLARTVAFAHDRGIVHRDLKPANIMLTVLPPEHDTTSMVPAAAKSNHHTPSESRTRIKISDFGLAHMEDSVTDLTATGQVIGTPAYMAPEQASGGAEAIGPALDIYSLGAILYELLTGRPPFRGTTLLDTLDQVRNNDPVHPRELQPSVPRDVETICLKCLEKNPARRYATALDLANDLRRFQDGDSISARPLGRIENLCRRIRRNPAVSALIAVILLLVAGGQTVIFKEMRRANLSEQTALADSRRADREREAADSERRKAEDARQQAVALQIEAEAERARAVESQALAEVALERTLTALNSVTTIGSALKSQPGVEHIGRNLLDQTLALYDELLKDQQNSPAVRSRRLMALISAGEIHRILNRFGSAQELLTEAAELIEPDLVSPEQFDQFHRATRIWWSLAVMRKDQNRWEESLAAFEKTLVIHDAALKVAPKNHLHRIARMNVLINIAVPLRNLYRLPEAAKVLEQAIEAGREFVAEIPGHQWARSELALALHDYSMILRDLKRDEEADLAFEEALAIRKQVFDEFPDYATVRIDMTRSWLDQATREHYSGNYEKSVALTQQGIDLLTPLVRRSPDVYEYTNRLVVLMNLRLLSTIKRAQKSEIEPLVEAMCGLLQSGRQRFPEDQYLMEQTAEWLQLQGNLLLDRGDETAAIEQFLAARQAIEAILAADAANRSPRKPPTNGNLQLSPQLALAPSPSQFNDHWNCYLLAWRFGTCPVKSIRDPERALALIDRALALQPNNSRYMHARGAILMEAGRCQEAAVEFERSMAKEETDYRERLAALPEARNSFSQERLEQTRFYHRLLQAINLHRLGQHEAAAASFKLVVVPPLQYSAWELDTQRYATEAREMFGSE